jgi:hypothetical protein
MSVCNVKVKYIRPRYRDLKEWMQDPSNLYIGRAGVVFIDGERFPKQASKWANPFKIGRDGDRDEVLAKYEEYIRERIRSGEISLDELRGKNLGCWCVEGDRDDKMVCHGQILLLLLKDIV